MMDAWIFGIKVIHRVKPVKVRTRPATGSRGRTGQRIIRIKLSTPPTVMMTTPASKRIRREKKPIKRETRRSRNM